MNRPIQVTIVGAMVACKEGLTNSWREVANWTADRLQTIYGERVRVRYFDLFDADCPSIPTDGKLPFVIVDEYVLSNGGKISTPLIRKKLEELGIYPLQEAKIQGNAFQYSFCTPGILTELVALFGQKPEANVNEIMIVLNKHLCRCTGYEPILQGALEAQKLIRAQAENQTQTKLENEMSDLIKKRILVVLAHPDDESFGMGGTLAKFSHYGAQVVLLCATRGEAGIFGVEPEIAGKIREKELSKAAEYLGVQVFFLDYHDGELSSLALNTLTKDIGGWIYAVEPDLILTFGPDGLSGHPDHIAVSNAVTQAVDQYFPESNLLYLAPSEATVLGCGVSSAETDSSKPLIAIDINGFKINKVKAIQSHLSQHPQLTGKPEKEVEKIPCNEYFSVARVEKKQETSIDWFLSIAQPTFE